MSLFTLLSGCSSAVSNKPRSVQEDDIRIAIFRSYLKPPKPEPQRKSKTDDWVDPVTVRFLSVDGKDPSDYVMKQFDERRPPVKRVSQSYNMMDVPMSRTEKLLQDKRYPGHDVRDRQTGAVGEIFAVDKIEWINGSEAKLTIRSYRGRLWADGSTYHVIFQDNEWVPVKDSVSERWVS